MNLESQRKTEPARVPSNSNHSVDSTGCNSIQIPMNNKKS